jgi:hypothetical protein
MHVSICEYEKYTIAVVPIKHERPGKVQLDTVEDMPTDT